MEHDPAFPWTPEDEESARRLAADWTRRGLSLAECCAEAWRLSLGGPASTGTRTPQGPARPDVATS